MDGMNWSEFRTVEEALREHPRACEVIDGNEVYIASCGRRTCASIVRDYVGQHVPAESASPDEWMEGSVNVFSRRYGLVESICFFFRPDRSFQFETPFVECPADRYRYRRSSPCSSGR